MRVFEKLLASAGVFAALFLSSVTANSPPPPQPPPSLEEVVQGSTVIFVGSISDLYRIQFDNANNKTKLQKMTQQTFVWVKAGKKLKLLCITLGKPCRASGASRKVALAADFRAVAYGFSITLVKRRNFLPTQ